MSKLNNYNGSIDLISGIRQKNNGDFPLAEAHAIQTREDGTRLDTELEEIKSIVIEVQSDIRFTVDPDTGIVTATLVENMKEEI